METCGDVWRRVETCGDLLVVLVLSIVETCFQIILAKFWREESYSHHVLGLLGKRMLAPECGERPGEN